jgi:hypothetical protein
VQAFLVFRFQSYAQIEDTIFVEEDIEAIDKTVVRAQTFEAA